MKRIDFSFRSLNEKAYDAYSNSDFVFFLDEEGTYFVASHYGEKPFELGTIEDVEEFLIVEE